MRKIAFRPLSFEKQMTVLLPVVMLFLLLVGVLAVSRGREAAGADPKEGSGTSAAAAVSGAPPTSFLVTVHGDKLQYLTVLTADPSVPRVGVCSYDPTTRLPDGTATEIYDAGGIRVLQTALQKSLSIPLDFYLDFSYDELQELVQYYGGGVGVSLPKAVLKTDDTGLPVSFPSGEWHLSAYQIYELMRSAEGEPTLSSPVASSLWCDMINRYLIEGRDLSRDFSVLASTCDTNLKIFHFESSLPTLRELVRCAPLGVIEERGYNR